VNRRESRELFRRTFPDPVDRTSRFSHSTALRSRALPYASSVVMKASMTSALAAAACVLISLVMGCVAVIVGMKIGGPSR